MPKQISVVASNKDKYKETPVTNQLGEAPINPTLSSKITQELIDVSYTYKNEFYSYNGPLGSIRGHLVDITLNIGCPYPPGARRPAYTAIPGARESMGKYIQEFIQLGVLNKVGHNEEIGVTNSVLIAGYNDI
ncbi:hypothetical protein O181_016004 [Austropuccinia psidii MF-1]|uniref:Uncharacterized protein n=1 Tax=Austropuccinia psidii MF-1 TaxID=1389203 RepID=A0A9Q3GRD3_9BASI|nr:hypothetical protein [Austropuccinia psidii MF-1]